MLHWYQILLCQRCAEGAQQCVEPGCARWLEGEEDFGLVPSVVKPITWEQSQALEAARAFASGKLD